MAAAVGDHGIPQTELSIQPAKEQAKAAVEQEATEDDYGCVTQQNEGAGQMSRGKEQGGHDVGGDQDSGGGQLALFVEELVQQECGEGQEEQPQHHFFNHRSIGDRGQQIGEGGLGGVGIQQCRNELIEEE